MAVITMGIVACSDIEESSPSYRTTLVAAVSSTTESKATFTDGGDEGIDLDWASGDKFSIYSVESGSHICDFACESDDDAASGIFVSGGTLNDGESYIAFYPASSKSTLSEARAEDLTSVQNGDEISNLNNACVMEAEFIYSENASMLFVHKKAVMTFTFESEYRPAKLVFDNGDSISYTINYTNIMPDTTGCYTSHIMVDTCASFNRTITFSLFNNLGEAYDVRYADSSKAYEAGCRYTMPVSAIEIDIAYVEDEENEDGVYQIYTANGLLAFANLVNGSGDSGANWIDYSSMSGTKSTASNNTNFAFSSTPMTTINGKLMKSISLESICSESNGTNWYPIGKINYYNGTFDGCGYEVQGIYIDSPYSQLALFGYTNVDGVVCNLGVTGTVTANNEDGSNHETAGIVAYNHGTVINCYNKATISGEVNVGGICGYNSPTGYIVNCYSLTNVSGHDTAKNIGGICGQSTGYMANCYATGEVSGTSNFGGVLGWFNNGKISTDSDEIYSPVLKGCYCLYYDSTTVIVGTISGLSSSCLTSTEMQSDAFVSTLNANTSSYNSGELENELRGTACAWTNVNSVYPVFE
ncbi:MAG: hypothetical protein SNG10_03355 [Rikenellaceae bacterium]